MTRAELATDPRGRELKGLVRWLIAGGTFAVAVLLGALALHSTTVSAQTGEFYGASIEVVGECGGGTIDFNLHEGGMSVELVFVQDFNAEGSPIDGAAVFEPGDVPISDGSFSVTFDADSPEDGEFSVSGTFAEDEVTGTVTLSPSTCADVPFTGRTATDEPTAPPEGALVIEADFEPIFDFLETGEPNCGGGEFIFTVYPDRAGVFSTETRGSTAGGVLIESFFSSFEPAEYPIDENGHSLLERPVTGGISARTEATFDFDADPPTVSGTLAIFPTSDPSAVICELDYASAAPAEVAAVPVTGSGPAGGSGAAMPLTLLTAALAAFGLTATGLAVLRRRNA